MNIVYVLVPLGLVLVGLGLWAFFWAVGSGQFDDLDTPAVRILFDDEEPHRPATVASSASARRPAGEGREASGAAMTPADPTRRVPE